jgi:hypothetical protein
MKMNTIFQRALAGAVILTLAVPAVAYAGDYSGSDTTAPETCSSAVATLLDARVKLASGLLDTSSTDNSVVGNLLSDVVGTTDGTILDLQTAVRLAQEKVDTEC